MKPKAINIIKYLLFFALGIILFFFAFRGHDVTKMYSEMMKANFSWILLSLFFGFLAFLSRAYRWILFLEPLGYKPKLKNTYHSVVMGYLANLAIPRIGEITRCATLSQLEKVPVNPLIGTVIVERVIDVLILLFSMLLVFLFNISLFGRFFYDNFILPVKNKLAGFNLLSFAITLLVIGLFIFLLYRSKSSRNWFSLFLQKVKKFLEEILEGIKSIGKLKNKGSFIFHSLFIWVMYYMMTYVCFFATQSTSHLGPVEALFVMVSGGLGMTAPVQGGIGVYHWIVSQSLTLFDIDIESGLIFATIVHTSQLLMTLFLGAVSMIWMFITNSIAKKQDGQA